MAEGEKCDDQDACTVDDVCTNFKCSGIAKCVAAGPCEMAYCNVTGECYVEKMEECGEAEVVNSSSEGMNLVAIIVAVVAGFVVLVIGAAAVLIYLKKKQSRETNRKIEELELQSQ